MPEELPDFIQQEDVDEAYGIMEWARHHIEEDNIDLWSFRPKMQKLKALHEVLEEAYDEGDADYKEFVDRVQEVYQQMVTYCN